MAFQAAGKRGDPIAAINVTPMADVMIVLLIIFMVTAPIIAGAPVKLPEAHTGKEAPEKRHAVIVRADGSVTVDGMATPRQGLATLLAGKEGEVWITADADASYTHVQEVLDGCHAAGVEAIGFEVQPEPR